MHQLLGGSILLGTLRPTEEANQNQGLSKKILECIQYFYCSVIFLYIFFGQGCSEISEISESLLTPPKTNIEPEHHLFEKEHHLPSTSIFGIQNVSFQGCRSFFTSKVSRFGSASLRFTYEPAVIRTPYLDRRLSVFFGSFFFAGGGFTYLFYVQPENLGMTN